MNEELAMFGTPCALHKPMEDTLKRIEEKIDKIDSRMDEIDHKLYRDNGTKSIQTQLGDSWKAIKALQLWQREHEQNQKEFKQEKTNFWYFFWPTAISAVALIVAVIQIMKGI